MDMDIKLNLGDFMKTILFAADTFRECNMFLNELAEELFEKGVRFDIDKCTMSIKTKNAYIISVSETSSKCGLFRRDPFDYYMLTGHAGQIWNGFHDFCISRMKIGAKEIQDQEELIRILCEE